MIINRYLTYIVFLFFFAIVTIAIYSDMSVITKESNNIEQVSSKLTKTLLLKDLIQELQQERGLTNIYCSSDKKRALDLLQKQREKVSNSFHKVAILKISTGITDIRKHVDKKDLSSREIFDSYTKIIATMLLETKKLLFFTNDEEIKNHFLIYQNTNFVQEYLGQIRAEIGSILEVRTISKQHHTSVLALETLVANYIEQTKENIMLTHAKIVSPLKKKCFIQTNKIIQSIIASDLPSITISSIEWFKVSTCAINSVNMTVTHYLKHIQEEVNSKLQIQKMKLYYHITFWISVLIISFILTLILIKTNKKMLVKQKLLEDYKKAIDSSTIVSKTDKNGIITYVNQAFCEISGYEESELIGKPHNMVRHPSVDKKTFEGLWKTIQSGKTWNGQIINLTKDKSDYWVKASISPIYDDENNLVEYIAIRHDITQIIELNKEIKSTQYELIYRMGESVESRSKESGHHIQRVAHYSKLLAQYYGLSNQEAEVIFIASTMHDMGKIAIPDSILLKKDKLDNDEWEIMKTHSAIGYNILAGSNLPILKMAADIAYEHHEHYNGNGYPRAIKGDDISIYARIVAIADVFDALISERVYKKAWSLDKTISLFEKESGKQFDPQLTQLFLVNIDKFMEIKEKFED